jgi:hypothetical protein
MTPRKKGARAGVGAAALAVVLAACSGSDGVTEAEYVRQANAVCRDGARRIAALRIPGRADVESMPQRASEVVTLQRRALARLRAIRPPEDDRAEIAKWIALVDQTVDQAEVSAESQRDGDISRALTANVNGAALDQRADELAEAYGLDDCVRAATPPPEPPSSTTTTTTATTTTTTSTTTTRPDA